MAKSVASTIVLGLFSCISLGIVFFGVRTRWKGMSSKDWPSTRGIIVSSSRTVHENRDPAYLPSSSSSSYTYGAAVQYTYTVSRFPFTGNRVAFGDYSTSMPPHANAIIARYPPGREVLVYYDPADPSYSVLERDMGGNGMVIAVGCWFALVSLFLLFKR